MKLAKINATFFVCGTCTLENPAEPQKIAEIQILLEKKLLEK